MLKQIHESHLGINKCKQRARETLFWPGMSQQVQNMVEDCPTWIHTTKTLPIDFLYKITATKQGTYETKQNSWLANLEMFLDIGNARVPKKPH